MSYNFDTPIAVPEEDRFNRIGFAKHMAKSLIETSNPNGLVMALYGKWGSGKTSLVNLIKYELIDLTHEQENKPLVFNFSPWNYSDTNNLIRLFFNKFLNEINAHGDTEFIRKIGVKLSRYASLFDALSPTIGISPPILGSLLKGVGESLQVLPDLEVLKEKIETLLYKFDKKIVIIIDDIDRLSNQQIKDIFQLVKQVADFPNTTYLLVMDRQIVSNALSSVHGIDGEEYLEKIVQVPLTVPALRLKSLQELLAEKISSFLSESNINVTTNGSYWTLVYEDCISPYIHNLRDVYRLVNTFQFRFQLVHEETSFEDMLAITTLEVFEPKLYNWIIEHKDLLCIGRTREIDTDQREEYITNEIIRLAIPLKRAKQILNRLFPIIQSRSIDFGLTGINRVAQPDRFSSYFMLDFSEIRIPVKVLNDSMFTYSEKELEQCIHNINDEGHIDYYLQRIKQSISVIPKDRLHIIASVLLANRSYFDKFRTYAFMSQSNYDIAESIIVKIMQGMTSGNSESLVLNLINENNVVALSSTADFLWKSLISSSNSSYKVNFDREKIKQKYLKIFPTIANKVFDEVVYHFIGAYRLWRLFDESAAESWRKVLIQSNTKLIKFYCNYGLVWTSSSGEFGWFFPDSFYKNEDEVKMFYSAIETLEKSKLGLFTDEDQLKMASFYLYEQKRKLGEDKPTVADACKIVDEWREAAGLKPLS